MASPCEALIDTDDEEVARRAFEAAAGEVRRIEAKFSRYRAEGAVAAINTAAGARTAVDEETARLLDFAATCHRLSGGMFDVTSGVLRRAWRFGPGASVPSQAQVASLLPLIGWGKVKWENPHIRLLPGMEIDLGGIGKEYAADRALSEAVKAGGCAALVNLGGDIAASGPRRGGEPWMVGVEDPSGGAPAGTIKVFTGGLATSGDWRRFAQKEGKRYGHILNPVTGWPVEEAPASVTVAERSCALAGMLATMAMLMGAGAEEFLAGQKTPHWIIR